MLFPFDGEATLRYKRWCTFFFRQQVGVRVEGGRLPSLRTASLYLGEGYLAGDFPGGITTVDAYLQLPTSACCISPTAGEPGMGVLVAD